MRIVHINDLHKERGIAFRCNELTSQKIQRVLLSNGITWVSGADKDQKYNIGLIISLGKNIIGICQDSFDKEKYYVNRFRDKCEVVKIYIPNLIEITYVETCEHKCQPFDFPIIQIPISSDTTLYDIKVGLLEGVSTLKLSSTSDIELYSKAVDIIIHRWEVNNIQVPNTLGIDPCCYMYFLVTYEGQLG